MKKDTEKTIVVFRKYKDGDVLALFPNLEGSPGCCVSYMALGQHSSADYGWCIQSTKPASELEYRPLQRELEDLGYNLTVRKKRS
jgi:hypothetical protein